MTVNWLHSLFFYFFASDLNDFFVNSSWDLLRIKHTHMHTHGKRIEHIFYLSMLMFLPLGIAFLLKRPFFLTLVTIDKLINLHHIYL
jgi:hypothetical protein